MQNHHGVHAYERYRYFLAAALLLIAPAGAVNAGVYEVGPGDDYQTTMLGLQAGDTLILDGGTYAVTASFAFLGTAELPIVIQAKTGQTPVFNQPDTNVNVFQISNATYFALDGIEFTGAQIGIRIIAGHDITVRNCHVHHADQGAISINTAGNDYSHINIVHNEIDHDGAGGLGDGIFLGCLADTCRVHDSLIADNYIHDQSSGTQGYGLLVRHGSYANVIQDNVFHDTLGPAIAIADVNGHGGPNVVERNLFWNLSDYGIQVGSDNIVRNNIVLQSVAAHAIAVLDPIVAPANVSVINNTILSSKGGIRITGASGAIMIANNAIYAPTGNAIAVTTPAGGTVTATANAGQGALSGVAAGFAGTGDISADFFGASLSGAPPQNVVPKGTLLPGGGDAGSQPDDDFCGHPRGAQNDIGAYAANSSGYPGCPVSDGFKVSDRLFAFGFEAWL